MTEHDLRLIEIGEKAGAEKATKQIIEWLRKEGEEYPSSQYSGFAAMIAEEIEAGEPFQ